jgi:hypothetical protein
MSYPFYPLFRLRVDKQWTLYVDADTQGELHIGMYYYLGDLFEILAGGKPTTPPEMLGKINQILRETEC